MLAPMAERARRGLAQPVDGASLAALRIGFGLILTYHMARHFQERGGRTLIDFLYVEPAFHFPYPGLEWLTVLPEPWMTGTFVVAGLGAIGIALGLFYRAAAVAFFLAYTYIFLADQAEYNNHYYLISLVGLLLSVAPAHRVCSIDAWRRPATPEVPFWAVFLFRYQLFCMYFFAGIAKINADWLTAVPMHSPAEALRGHVAAWLPLPDAVTIEHFARLLAWGGLVFDLSIGFLLLFRRTRWLALLLLAGFHGTNHVLFPIGIFPAMAFWMTLIFLSPDWPRRFARWIRRRPPESAAPPRAPERAAAAPLAGAMLTFVVGWVVLQATVPLRHFFIPGDANWTEEGQDFSWRMMLRMKTAGHVLFYVRDPGLFLDEKPTRADWEQWPADAARMVHVPTDARRFDWSTRTGLMVLYEPLHGYRVVWNPGPSDAPEASVLATWEARFGRLPALRETTPVPDALEQIAAAIRSARESDPVLAKADALADLGQLHARWLARGAALPAELAELSRATIDLLERLQVSRYGVQAEPFLVRLAPFALQYGRPAPAALRIVDDPQLDFAQRSPGLEALSGGNPALVWIDWDQLPSADWRALPQILLAFEEGRLRAVWNHFRELNHFQTRRMSVRPHLMNTYARLHIAEEWKQRFGRRPEVYASSLVMLNYKRPQRLVDPSVDLASAGYSTLRRNPWILPKNPGANAGD